MKLQVVGCSHHNAPIQLRERLAFSEEKTRQALAALRSRFPQTEAVVLSTCNRVELYFASEQPHACPTHQEVAQFLSEFHGVPAEQLFDDLYERTGEDAIRHLFTVAASLDSMVVGEPQILAQVKRAFQVAREGNATGPLMHMAFEAALRVAKRVASETTIQQRRVSIPSIAVCEFARGLFEHLQGKRALVIGAGEMAAETVRYLLDEGVTELYICNRNPERGHALARQFGGTVVPWEQLEDQLVAADLVISATGSTEPIMTAERFRPLVQRRAQRVLFILDLAVPRDFEPAVGKLQNVYLYAVDDLQQVCERNRRQREKEWPKAERIIQEETARFMAELNHRATAPTIRRLRARAEAVKQEELTRLLNKLDSLDPRHKREIEIAMDRLVNKLLHPPLESLRDAAHHHSTLQHLLDAFRKLFQIKED